MVNNFNKDDFKLVKVNVLKPQTNSEGMISVREYARFAVQVCDPSKQYYNFLVSILNQSIFGKKLTESQMNSFVRILKKVLIDFKNETGVDILI